MPWIRLDDQFPDHPKVIDAGPLAAWLYVCGIGYCNRLLTDGHIPSGQVRKLADVDNAGELAATLVRVGLWEEVEGGYRIHDYLDYQPSAEQVKAERAATARRQHEWRERNKGRNGVSNAVTDTVSNAPRNATVTGAPYPPRTRTHPDPKKRDVSSSHDDDRASATNHAARFAAFWHAYPKKVGKKACAEWWQKRKPDDDLTQTILDGVETYKRSETYQRNFVKDPINWLKEERWTDEPDEPAQRGPLGRDKERVEVLQRALERRGYGPAGTGPVAYANGSEVSHEPIRIGDRRRP
jgi:hypothetical protein